MLLIKSFLYVIIVLFPTVLRLLRSNVSLVGGASDDDGLFSPRNWITMISILFLCMHV